MLGTPGEAGFPVIGLRLDVISLDGTQKNSDHMFAVTPEKTSLKAEAPPIHLQKSPGEEFHAPGKRKEEGKLQIRPGNEFTPRFLVLCRGGTGQVEATRAAFHANVYRN